MNSLGNAIESNLGYVGGSGNIFRDDASPTEELKGGVAVHVGESHLDRMGLAIAPRNQSVRLGGNFNFNFRALDGPQWTLNMHRVAADRVAGKSRSRRKSDHCGDSSLREWRKVTPRYYNRSHEAE